MKKFVSLLAVTLVASSAAFAAIVNSKHDFSFASTSGGAKATSATETQACKFCHVPHGGNATAPLLWSHTNTAGTTYNWGTGVTKTTAGTNLPTTAMTASAQRCYACHDGTIAVGSTTINGTTSVIALSTAGGVGASGLITAAASLVKGNAMAGNHPVSIPYPGSAGAYNGITSAAPVVDYKAITTTGCLSTSGVCVAGTASTGLMISLVRDLTVSTNYGVECTSCHDPHTTTNGKFLVVSNASSNLCSSCHNK